MKLPQKFIFLLLLFVSCVAPAERTPGFSMSAFNLALPSTRNAVFSPYAFEVDAVVVSEALGPIEKAKYVESLGALVGYENIYGPIVARYRDAASNDFQLVSARAYLATSMRLVSTKYRIYVQSEYGVQTCPSKPDTLGAESYFKAAMDGAMEDFAIPAAAQTTKGVSFVDLEALHCHWTEPFPSDNARRIAFTGEDGARSEVLAMTDVRNGDMWETDRFTMLRLPMADGSFFHAILPSASNNLASVRGEFAAEKLDSALLVARSIVDPGVYHGAVAVVIPELEFDTTCDLAPVFIANGLPLGGFKEIFNNGKPLNCICQRTRFALNGRGPGGTTTRRKPADRELPVGGARKFVCNRPFLFFVYHEPTRSIPVAGIYAGGK